MKKSVPFLRLNRLSSLHATAEEQSVIKNVIERAQQISPGTRVRFVQREKDGIGTLLVISLSSPNSGNDENYALYEIAHELEERDGLSLVVTQSKNPIATRQLLKLRPFLSEGQLSADVREPKKFNVIDDKTGELRDIDEIRPQLERIFLLTVVVCLLYPYAADIFGLPKIFGSDRIGTKSELTLSSIKRNMDDSIKEIDAQLSQQHLLSQTKELTQEQVQELKRQKELLERARKQLE